ncbi:apyrase-like [Anopheles bellator]|uniref:apyrase-like n=1 Tax=Anopheles bellator TaxID=139047 RepID=UPI002649308E|nr:apyrase-like [Anopheles bellator]
MDHSRSASVLLISLLVLQLGHRSVHTKNVPGAGGQKEFPLTLIHINDLHARFDETNLKSAACENRDECIAGVARVYHTIKQLKQEYSDRNPLYLNAGDNFQGTLWYTLLRWNVTAQLIKLLPPDAMTLGNHEFDHRPEGLAPYLKELQAIGIPTIVANLEKNGEPALEGVSIPRSIVRDVKERKVGVIGALYDKTHNVSPTGKVTFTNAVEAIRKEAQQLKSQGVGIVVVLSHLGLDGDKQLAQEAGELLDVIVGAHSHSLLLNQSANTPYDRVNDKVEESYPVVVDKGNNHKVLITQARSYGKYVGRLTVYFDEQGEVQRWEGHPIYMTHDIAQDEAAVQALKPWRDEVTRLGNEKIGKTEVLLDHASCRWCECTLGSLVADSFVANYTNTERPLVIGVVLAGTFRNPISKGDITNGLAIEASPYGSSADLVKLSGKDLRQAIEQSLTLDDEFRYNTMQVSGLTVEIDLTQKPLQRVKSIKLAQTKASLDDAEEYYVATTSYLADGRNGFTMMKHAKERTTGPLDSDVLIHYIHEKQTITKDMFAEPRVIVTHHTNGTCTRNFDRESFTKG